MYGTLNIERDYLLAGPRMAARVRKKIEDIPFADSDANQLTEKELAQSLNACMYGALET